MSSKTTKHKRWRVVGSNKDGLMRYPRDSKTWKTFNTTHPEFALNPRNVCLVLANDGFNAFGNISTNYNIWLVILITCNLLPWICMK